MIIRRYTRSVYQPRCRANTAVRWLLTTHCLYVETERGKNSMEEIISLISNVGFPCFMCAYVVIRLEPMIQTLIQSINALVNIVNNHNE